MIPFKTNVMDYEAASHEFEATCHYSKAKVMISKQQVMTSKQQVTAPYSACRLLGTLILNSDSASSLKRTAEHFAVEQARGEISAARDASVHSRCMMHMLMASLSFMLAMFRVAPPCDSLDLASTC